MAAHSMGVPIRAPSARRLRSVAGGWQTRWVPRRLPTIATALIGVLLLGGCGSGATATGRPTSVASANRASVAPPTPKQRTATPTATPTENRVLLPGPAPVDYRLQEGAGTLAVKTFSWQRTGNGQGSAPPKQRYLVLDVLLTAREGTVLVNPLYFVTLTADQQVMVPTMGADGNEPVLASKTLKHGESVGGIVAFDTPPGPVTVVLNDELGNRVAVVSLPAPAD